MKKHSLVLAFLASAASLHAQQTVDYLNGLADSTNYTTTAPGAITLSVASGTAIQSGIISGNGQVIKVGLGTLFLSGSNTYTGLTTVSAGTLAISANERIANTGALTIGAGGTFDLSGYTETVGAVTLAGGSIIGSGTLSGSDFVVQSGTVSASLGGLALLTKTTPGTVILTGANTYGFATQVTEGTLQIGDGISGSLASNAIVVSVGATVAFNTPSTYSSFINNNGLVEGRQSAGVTTTFSAAILGISGSFTQTGPGTTLFTATNSYAGATTVNAGTLQIGNGAAGSILVSSAVSIAPGGTLAFNTTATLPNNIANAGLVEGRQSAGTTTTLGGVISGDGGFTQAGPGATILTGASTYTGPTNVTGGRLIVHGSLSAGSPIVIQGAGTLGGHGITGPLSILDGGAISPGASGSTAGYLPTTLTTGAETWGSGGRYVWNLADATGAAGAGWDFLSIGGPLTITSTSEARFTIHVQSLNGTAVGAAVHFDPALSQSWIIATAATGWAFDPDQFAIGLAGFANSTQPGSIWTLSQVGNSLQLNYAAVPEPGTYGLLGVALGILALTRWRSAHTRRA